MEVVGLSEAAYLAAWKALEYGLRSFGLKWDLVQLAGHYRARPRLAFQGEGFPEGWWQALGHLLEGRGLGVPKPLEELEEILGLAPGEGQGFLAWARGLLGIDVRSPLHQPQPARGELPGALPLPHPLGEERDGQKAPLLPGGEGTLSLSPQVPVGRGAQGPRLPACPAPPGRRRPRCPRWVEGGAGQQEAQGKGGYPGGVEGYHKQSSQALLLALPLPEEGEAQGGTGHLPDGGGAEEAPGGHRDGGDEPLQVGPGPEGHLVEARPEVPPAEGPGPLGEEPLGLEAQAPLARGGEVGHPEEEGPVPVERGCRGHGESLRRPFLVPVPIPRASCRGPWREERRGTP